MIYSWLILTGVVSVALFVVPAPRTMPSFRQVVFELGVEYVVNVLQKIVGNTYGAYALLPVFLAVGVFACAHGLVAFWTGDTTALRSVSVALFLLVCMYSFFLRVWYRAYRIRGVAGYVGGVVALMHGTRWSIARVARVLWRERWWVTVCAGVFVAPALALPYGAFFSAYVVSVCVYTVCTLWGALLCISLCCGKCRETT